MNSTLPQSKWPQLKRRIITALILAIIIVTAIFVLPKFEFVLAAVLLIAIAGWEWSLLIGLDSPIQSIIYLAILFAAFFFAYYFSIFVLVLAVIWWLMVLLLVIFAPQKGIIFLKNKFFGGIAGLFLLVPCWTAIIVSHQRSPGYLLYGLFLIWSADTGAYIAGRLWGKHKLAPNISPGKTIEGVAGGLVTALVVAVIGGLILKIPAHQWLWVLALAVVVVFTSVLGDLFESLIKRHAGVKDSGNWLPGHGGLLDRIDGVTAALPFYALGILLLHL